MRLAIGTAQFGLSYGVANQGGKVSLNEVKKILAHARQSGINLLDTAIAYGDSENVLGGVGIDQWEVITKLPAIPLDVVDIGDWMQKQVHESLERLNLLSVYAVLLHRPEQLLGDRGLEILFALRSLKINNLTKKIGISIYSPSELDNFDVEQFFDLIQAPLNILDRSLIESGWLKKLNQLKIEVHIRSVFLQGLLLMNSEERPPKFSKYTDLWLEWDRWLAENNFSAVEACLAFINSIEGLDGVLVGIESAEQLSEIIKASSLKLENIPSWPKNIDPNLINPSMWASL
jgi:aryl-alcohol dehydrogenase-like predicted oxidoreductase